MRGGFLGVCGGSLGRYVEWISRGHVGGSLGVCGVGHLGCSRVDFQGICWGGCLGVCGGGYISNSGIWIL